MKKAKTKPTRNLTRKTKTTTAAAAPLPMTPKQLQKRATAVKTLRTQASRMALKTIPKELRRYGFKKGNFFFPAWKPGPLLSLNLHIDEPLGLPSQEHWSWGHFMLHVEFPAVGGQTRMAFAKRLKRWIDAVIRADPMWFTMESEPGILTGRGWTWKLVNGSNRLSVHTPEQWRSLWLLVQLVQIVTLADVLAWDQIDPA